MLDCNGSLDPEFLAKCQEDFYDALDGPPAEDNASEAPAEGNPKASSTSEESRPSATGEQI